MAVMALPTLTFDPSKMKWAKAQKTKNMLAMPVRNIRIPSVLKGKLFLETLEGQQMLDAGKMLCTGIGMGDPWQQPMDKILNKYDLIGEDGGWLVFKPKPSNVVEVCRPFYHGDSEWDRNRDWKCLLEVEGKNGQKYADGKCRFYGHEGDYVCRSIDDPSDVWIVNEKLFEASYIILPETKLENQYFDYKGNEVTDNL